MKTSILYIFLLSVLYACDSHSLLPPKQQLDQQIAQLNDYSLLSGPLNDQLCEEIETHAQEIGNDSLLLATRQIIYTRYCRLQDTAHARMLLDRMKPYAIRIKDKHLLMNHLRMAFLHAQTRQPAECERWINEARKYAYINPQNWYITAANACLECGLYPQALIYADSALVNLKYKVISSPHLVKYSIKPYGKDRRSGGMDPTMHYRYPPLSGETPNTHDQLSAISTLHGIRRLSPETWKKQRGTIRIGGIRQSLIQ